MLRHLRFAPAAAFALLALAFVGLWVRSYYWQDIASGMAANGLWSLNALNGVVSLRVTSRLPPSFDAPGQWSIGRTGPHNQGLSLGRYLGFDWKRGDRSHGIAFPH